MFASFPVARDLQISAAFAPSSFVNIGRLLTCSGMMAWWRFFFGRFACLVENKVNISKSSTLPKRSAGYASPLSAQRS
jgi:hypothetical protein